MLLLLLFLCADSFEASLRAGLIALNSNQLSVAKAELEGASHLQPNDARAWLGLAQTYRKLGNPTQADAAAARVEGLSSQPQMLRALALYYSEAGNPAKTADVVRRALQMHLDESTYFFLADVCLKQQNFELALDAAISGLTTFDRSSQLKLTTGVAYYGLRRFPEAIDAFLSTVKLDPAAEQPYRFLGRMLEQAEDKTSRVQAAFAAFAQRAPDNYLSSFYYGKSLVLTNTSLAEAFLKKSIALNDNFAESHFEMSVALEAQQRFEEAAQQMRRAAALDPNDPVAHYRLARLYDRLGKPDDARAERGLHKRLTDK